MNQIERPKLDHRQPKPKKDRAVYSNPRPASHLPRDASFKTSVSQKQVQLLQKEISVIWRKNALLKEMNLKAAL